MDRLTTLRKESGGVRGIITDVPLFCQLTGLGLLILFLGKRCSEVSEQWKAGSRVFLFVRQFYVFVST